MDENSILKKKLLYRSIYRGCKEMDILLGEFAKSCLDQLSQQELEQYIKLLDAPDNDLYDWITGKSKPPFKYDNEILKRCINFSRLGGYIRGGSA